MNDAEDREQLEVYLKDHYAAGVGALELIRHSRKSHEGTPWAAFFAELENEVEADHEQLHNLIQALGLDDSGVRNAGAWMAEKLGRAKLGFAGGDTSELRLLQTLESLALGIKGKQLLWRALAAVRRARCPPCRKQISSCWKSALSTSSKRSKRNVSWPRRNR